MDITFTKTAVNAWSWAASDPTLDGGATSSGSAVGTGAITFDTDGTPLSFPPAAPSVALTGFTTGAGNSTITLDLGTVAGTDALPHYPGAFTTSNIHPDDVRFCKTRQRAGKGNSGSVLVVHGGPGNR